jgi:hypothetical protein
MVGPGKLLTDDNSEYTGMFASECQLHGKGTLTLGGGDVISGSFNGERLLSHSAGRDALPGRWQ